MFSKKMVFFQEYEIDDEKTFFGNRRVLDVLRAKIFFGARSIFIWPNLADTAKNVQNRP